MDFGDWIWVKMSFCSPSYPALKGLFDSLVPFNLRLIADGCVNTTVADIDFGCIWG